MLRAMLRAVPGVTPTLSMCSVSVRDQLLFVIGFWTNGRNVQHWEAIRSLKILCKGRMPHVLTSSSSDSVVHAGSFWARPA